MDTNQTRNYRVVARGRNFTQAVKFLKKIGGQFDPQSKTWFVGRVLESDSCRLWGLQPVESAEFDSYRDWSDNPNSIL